MDIALSVVVGSFLVSVLLLGALGLSISLIGVLFLSGIALLLSILLVASPFFFVSYLLMVPFIALYYLWQYHPQYARWIKHVCLEKPLLFFKKHYVYPLSTLPNRPTDANYRYGLLGLIGVATLLMFLLTYQVITNGTFTRWNLPIYHAMREIRSIHLEPFFIQITLFNSFIMGCFWATMAVYFTFKKDAWRTVHWVLLGALVALTVSGLKGGFDVARPGAVFRIKDSFPSAHVTTHMAFLGGLLLLLDLGSTTTSWVKGTIYSIYAIWTALIALSRLYLAAHWFTDIVGGVLLSCISLAIVRFSYYRKIAPAISHSEVSLISLISLVSLWLLRFVLEYDSILKFYLASI